MGHFFCKISGGEQNKKVFVECSADFVPKVLEGGGKAKLRSGSGRNPHLLMKLDPNPQKKTVISGYGSVANSAINLTDNLIVREQ